MKLSEILQEYLSDQQFNDFEGALLDALDPYGIDRVYAYEIDRDDYLLFHCTPNDENGPGSFDLRIWGTFEDDDSAKVTGWSTQDATDAAHPQHDGGNYSYRNGQGKILRVLKYNNTSDVKAFMGILVNELNKSGVIASDSSQGLQEGLEDDQDLFAQAIAQHLGDYIAEIQEVSEDMMEMYIIPNTTMPNHRKWGPFMLTLYGTFEDEESAKIESWQTTLGGMSGSKRGPNVDHLDADGDFDPFAVRFDRPASRDAAAKKIAEALMVEGVAQAPIDKFVAVLGKELAKHPKLDPWGIFEVLEKHDGNEIEIRWGKPHTLTLHGDFSNLQHAHIIEWEWSHYERYDGRYGIIAQEEVNININLQDEQTMSIGVEQLVASLQKHENSQHEDEDEDDDYQ